MKRPVGAPTSHRANRVSHNSRCWASFQPFDSTHSTCTSRCVGAEASKSIVYKSVTCTGRSVGAGQLRYIGSACVRWGVAIMPVREGIPRRQPAEWLLTLSSSSLSTGCQALRTRLVGINICRMGCGPRSGPSRAPDHSHPPMDSPWRSGWAQAFLPRPIVEGARHPIHGLTHDCDDERSGTRQSGAHVWTHVRQIEHGVEGQ